MKIISPFADYYDFISKLSFNSETLTYNRLPIIDISNKNIFNCFKIPIIPDYIHLGKKFFIKKISFKTHRIFIGKYIFTYLEQIYNKNNTSFFRVITDEDKKYSKELPNSLEIQKFNYNLLLKIGEPIIKVPDCKYMNKLTTIEIPNLSHIQGIHNVLNPYTVYEEIESFLINKQNQKTIKKDRSKRYV